MGMKGALTAVGVAAALTMAGAQAQDLEEKLKLGFVYLGAIGDHGWTYEHNRAQLQTQAEFEERMETVYAENVPEAVAQRAQETEAAIVAETLRVFAEPVRDRSEKVMVDEGRWLSDAALAEMDWYVEGVVGALPKCTRWREQCCL